MKQTLKYWSHYRESTSIWKAHSPFVYQFYRNVLKDKQEEIFLKKAFLDADSSAKRKANALTSKKQKNSAQKAAFIFRPKYNRLFHRLITYFEITTFLEIGQRFLPFARVWPSEESMESEIDLLPVKGKMTGNTSLKTLCRIKNAGCLEKVVEKQGMPEMVYVEEAVDAQEVLFCFEKLCTQSKSNTLLIFGGIHHSLAMEKAWEEIKNKEKVTFTLDLFYLGFVFFKPEFKEKQHFKLRY